MSVMIGVDMGTSAIKIIAYDHAGKILFYDKTACVVIQPSPEKAEQDPVLILQAVAVLLKKAFVVCSKDDIRGVCFSAAMHSLIAMDEEGNCLTNAILWGDTRSIRQAGYLKSTGLAESLYVETGVPIHPALPLCKIMWLRQEMPELFDKTAVFISLKEYVYYNLFGKYLIDHSMAAATGMQHIHTLQWQETCLQVAGIREEQLSGIVPATHTERTLKKEYRDYFGLEKEIPFIIGSTDGCLANIGTGVLDPSRVSLTIGTSGAVRTTMAMPVLNQSSLFCYPLIKDVFIRGGPTNNGGYVLGWFAENFLSQTLRTEKDYEMLVNEAGSVNAGADSLIFLPYLQGERAPVWNAEARGVFFGLHVLHKRAHLIRAVIEGINNALYDVFCTLTSDADPVETLYVSGGFIQSDIWVQMIADLFNKKVIVTEETDASAIGAACLGFYAVGIIRRMDEIQVSKQEHVFIPVAENHRIYMRNFAIYRSLYLSLEKEFTKLHIH